MSHALLHALAAAATAGACLAVAWPIADVSALALSIGALALAAPLAPSRGRQGLIVIAVGAFAAALAANARDATLAPPLGLWFAARSTSASGGASAAAAPVARGAPPLRGAPRSRSSPRPSAAPETSVAALGQLAAMVAAGPARTSAVTQPPLGSPSPERDEGGLVMMRGVLEADAAQREDAVQLRVAVRAVRGAPGEGWTPTRGRVLLHVQGDLAHESFRYWTRGRGITTTATLRWPPVLQNPGGAAPMLQRLRRGYVLSGTIKSATLVDVTRAAWWQEAAATVRRHVRRTVADTFGSSRTTTAAIVTAILIGDRGGLDRELTERLVAAGTYHVIAISGGNVALVTLIVIVTLRHLVRAPRAAAVVALLVVAAYGWIVGPEPSVQRAVTAACIWLAAEALGVRAPPTRIFSVVALAVVMFDPLIVVMPGAWLSFGATLGILVFTDHAVAGVIAHAWPQRPVVNWLAGAVTGLAAATIAAEAALLPVSAWTFSRVGAAGVLLNFVAIPAMSMVQVAGALVVLTADVWGFAARQCAEVAHLATVALTDSARLVEWAPRLSWRVAPPEPATVAAYYAALVLAAARYGSRTIRRVSAAGVLVCACVIANPPDILRRGPPTGTLRLTVLDVGQGDAMVLQFPSGQVLVLDAGPASEAFDTGERVVTPALWALGVRRVDWVAYSHADGDHIGGLAAVAMQFDAREIWEGVPVETDARRAGMRRIAAEQGAVWRGLRRGDRWEAGGAQLEVVHPPDPDWHRPRVRNDDSLVFRLRYGRFEALLTGDIGRDVERDLVMRADPRMDPLTTSSRLRVLKVAHHGRRTSSSHDFLARYRPWAAIVSAGRNNPFGHPAPEVTMRLGEVGATTLRTDRDGAVSIETDGTTLSMKTWAGRRWRVSMAEGP